jgi:formylglycine-generating enzyme required for sulfatase activity
VVRLRPRALCAALFTLVLAAVPARAFMSPAIVRPAKIGAEMVLVPGSKLRVGAPARWGGPRAGVAVDANTATGNDVVVRSFLLDRTEVTAAAWQRCVDEHGCPQLVSGDTSEPNHTSLCTSGRLGREGHPVTCVDWSEAAGYCEWAHKRLPTEAEFELASRGTSERAFPWGDEPPQPKHLNACDARCVEQMHKDFNEDTYENLWADVSGDDGFGFTAPVGSYPAGASPYGVLDLAGNVEEWVADPWGVTPGLPPAAGPDVERVVRGGSWDFATIDLFVANRRTQEVPTLRASWLGFRCARDP